MPVSIRRGDLKFFQGIEFKPTFPVANSTVSHLDHYLADAKASWRRKLVNSYLTPRFLYGRLFPRERWQQLFNEVDQGLIRSPQERAKFMSALGKYSRLLWFIPNDLNDIRPWIAADLGDVKEYTKYIEGSACDQVFCDLIEQYVPDKNASLLELGSNVGRIVNKLVQRQYVNIQGVELNRNAVNASTQVFGEEVGSRIERNAIQPYLMDAADNSFDAVVTFGATIELVHPAFDVIRHMCRVARKSIVIYVNENAHAYPRFYAREFERWGFINVFHQKAVGDVTGVDTRNSFLVFVKPNG